MLLSGRWPLQTGVVDNAIRLRDEEFSLGEAFRRTGYHTGYIGKWHLSAGDREAAAFIPKGPARHGFEDWQVWSDTVRHFGAFTFDPDSGVWRQLLLPVTTFRIAALYTAAGSAATRVFDFAPAALAR